MCGIAGYVTTGEPEQLNTWLPTALTSLRHRGPNASGIWTAASGSCALGHRRLAIIDLDSAANQPLADRTHDVHLVFNGHIYNYVEVKSYLQRQGLVFRTASDTEVLLQSYIYWGKACLQKLHGFFAFAIWDGRSRELLVARDRLGEKPVYYAGDDKSCVFASEIHALPLSEVARGVDDTSLADYLVYGFVPAPKTVWKGVKQLEPGCVLTLSLNEWQVKREHDRYWTPNMSCLEKRTRAEMVEGLRYHCETAAKMVTRSDVQLGCLLSGGVDSSGVVGFVAPLQQTPLRTFSVGFDCAGSELPWARRVADLYQTDHREVYCREGNVEAALAEMWKVYGEPFDDGSQINALMVFRQASEECSVVLTGDGADEIYCGYSKYSRLRWLNRLRGWLPRQLWRGGLQLLRAGAPSGSRMKEQLNRLLSCERELLTDLSANGIRPREVKQLLPKRVRDYDPRWHIERRLDEVAGADSLTKLRYLDLTFKLPGQMLFKVDRASMAASLESRAFYLYTPLLDYSLSLPADLLAEGSGKSLLKQALESVVPRENLYRKKEGFGLQNVDHKAWFTPGMESYLSATLGVRYAPALSRANCVRAQRLYFGARSLYEWAQGAERTQRTTSSVSAPLQTVHH